MWVVKIGGSLLSSDALRPWIEALACYGGGNVVVVPGGGLFADQVRATQQQWGYDNAVAHRMALLAMEQFGILMSGLRPELVPAATLDEIEGVLDSARVPVWMPSELVLANPGLPACWDLTSDSLAAWLARRVGASRLLLVKSRGLDGAEVRCATVTRSGVVDALFGEFLQWSGIEAWVCGPDAHAQLPAALYAQSGYGTRIAPEPGNGNVTAATCGQGPALTCCCITQDIEAQ